MRLHRLKILVMRRNNPVVKINDHLIGEGRYILGGQEWDMSTLINATEGLPVFDLQLAALDLSVYPWGNDGKTLMSFLYHFKRIKKVNLSNPVIMDPTGYIIDGWHRVAKAIINGKTTIKAIRLLVMPEPDVIKTKD